MTITANFITDSDIDRLDLTEPPVPRDVAHDFKRVPLDLFGEERDKLDAVKTRFGFTSRRDAIRACIGYVYENSC